jgi:hypothetical protein
MGNRGYVYCELFGGAGYRVIGIDDDFIFRDELTVQTVCRLLTMAFYSGRESRDGLREELKRIRSVVGEIDFDLIGEVLFADQEAGK